MKINIDQVKALKHILGMVDMMEAGSVESVGIKVIWDNSELLKEVRPGFIQTPKYLSLKQTPTIEISVD